MAQRVLATDTAVQKVGELNSLLQGGLHDQIEQLKQIGDILSDPNVWDGTNAYQFRQDIWPKVRNAVITLLPQLEELQSQIQQITNNIMVAGGNA